MPTFNLPDHSMFEVQLTRASQELRQHIMVRAEEIGAQIELAMKQYITSDAIQLEIFDLCKKEIDNAVKGAIRAHYQYGEGQQIISAAVKEALEGKLK